MRFRAISKAIMAARGNRKEVVTKILEAIKQQLKGMHIEAEVSGRENIYTACIKKCRVKPSRVFYKFTIFTVLVVIRQRFKAR